MLGWSAVDIPMLLALPVLLALSAFFSGSETALFGLTGTERMLLRRGGSFAGRATEALLADERMLLITILVGNMTVNVLYFVITSVLIMKVQTQSDVVVRLVLGAVFLVVIIITGEVTPKLVANARRVGVVGLVAAPVLTVHRLLGPMRIAIDRLVVSPLSRLTSPGEAPTRLDEQELTALLEISGSRGVIDEEEQRILQDVINLGQLKVRAVMTPRVRIAALPSDAGRDDVRRLVEQTRLTKFPVFERDLDHIVGVLGARRYLLDPPAPGEPLQPRLSPVHFVPEMASLDQLLNRFRETQTQFAVVVDEFGGTAGVVAIEDVVEELVGDIAGPAVRRQPAPPVLVGAGRWRVGGDTSVHDWAEAFGQRLVSRRVATLGGLIIARLGRAPHAGDVVELGNVRLEVESVDRARVESVIVTLASAAEAAP